jgi:hypothetical protein
VGGRGVCRGEQGRAETAAVEAAPGSVGAGDGVQATRGHARPRAAGMGVLWSTQSLRAEVDELRATLPSAGGRHDGAAAAGCLRSAGHAGAMRALGQASAGLRLAQSASRHLLRRFRCHRLTHRASTVGSMGAGNAASAFSLPGS